VDRVIGAVALAINFNGEEAATVRAGRTPDAAGNFGAFEA
jgi:hypothetical protein